VYVPLSQVRVGRPDTDSTPFDHATTYAELIARARRGNLIGHATNVTSAKPDPLTGKPGASAHYHQAVAAAEVAVDMETGRVRLLRLHAGVFVGLAINPTLCELQMEGCLTMGAGQALFEELVVDGGQIVNANLADYLIPAFEDMPAVVNSALYEEPDHPDIHGIGEVAAPVVAPAIANAVADAAGVRVRDLPLTPERVLRALRGYGGVP
jgi:CO/xanthine dehydrogenase Mo-binding subunit